MNYLLGAPDAHAKNYSVLLVGGSVRLAPLYDISSGFAATRDGELRFPKAAMSIGGARTFGEVDARNWARFANVCGLPTDQIREWVTTYASAVADAMRDVIRAAPATAQDARVLDETVLPQVAQLANTTLAGLDKPTNGRGRSAGAASREIAAKGFR